jgi:hypothetical protein
MKTKSLAIFNLVALAFHILLSYLTQQKKLSSLDVGQVSAKYDSLFAPAGVTFAIWGLIYISLAAFCIYHLYTAFTKDESHHSNIDIRSIRWLFAINNIATGLWLVAWVNEQIIVSVVLILIQLVTLILISIRAHISNPERPFSTKIFTQFPLSIYLGWICIATIANISAYLVSIDWQGFGISADYWVIIMIGSAALISLFIILVRRNFFFGLVVLWALYGIVLKRQEIDANRYGTIINAAWAAFIIVLIALAMRLFRKTATVPITNP